MKRRKIASGLRYSEVTLTHRGVTPTMRRFHLFEIEDQPWCPRVLRDAATDFLQFMVHLGRNYAPAAPRLRDLLRRTGHTRVVDLCSGGGGPWVGLYTDLSAEGLPGLQVALTDLYPNRAAHERLSALTAGAVSHHPQPVDASSVPPELAGVRTLFSGFHHFSLEAARAVLANAVDARQPIAIFEAAHRSVSGLLGMLFTPLAVLLVTPAIRPFRVSRLFWTYVLPLLPLIVLFDGCVSCLRVYTPAELLALTAGLGAGTYHWEAGEDRGPGPLPVTYLIGYPVEAVASNPSLEQGAG